MDVTSLARALRAEARRADERRLLVLAGDADAGFEAAREALNGAGVDPAATTTVTDREGPGERLDPDRTERLLGRTREAVVLDCHGAFSPNAVGRTVGAVDGGGLYLLVCPPLEDWPDRRNEFDRGLAVPPFDVEDVGGNFRRRFVDTLRAHQGVAVVDVDSRTVRDEGLTDPPERRRRHTRTAPGDREFPREVYEACLTDDQVRAVGALEGLLEGPTAVVLEADRGRGKSAAAGLAAAGLALEGRDVLVTAPGFRNAREAFVRARAVLDGMGELAADGDRRLSTPGGLIRFEPPGEAADLSGDPDAVVVDEAASFPVGRLERFLAADAVAFSTTVHGYEGAGRGFSVRFRDRLEAADREVVDVRLAEPVRYAPGDPVETWAFRALALDARPPIADLVVDATPETCTYDALSPADLLADEQLLGEAFGLLVLAHYRTEPDDLARLLDAPNLSVRALRAGGRVVSVALLAREGGLPADLRKEIYEGARVRGNMLPDVLTSQLRDEAAADPVGYRVVRIATHHAARSRGLGSRLLGELREEFGSRADWLGVGYGATPELLEFWRSNGYRTVHLSATRNDASGEYSAVMLDPTSTAGRRLRDRHGRWFRRRVRDGLSDGHRDVDPDVVRAVLRSAPESAREEPALSGREWRVVVAAADGPGLYSAAPGAVRELALSGLVDGEASLTAREGRLLVRKVLQGHPWDRVADELDYVSTSECMRALGDALGSLVDVYGGEVAERERRRYTEGG